MQGWQSLLLVTILAAIVGTPWVRVAIARDQSAVIKEVRIAAMMTVIVIAVLWAGWVLGPRA
jgi:non-ribosomal peptide synthetase component F